MVGIPLIVGVVQNFLLPKPTFILLVFIERGLEIPDGDEGVKLLTSILGYQNPGLDVQSWRFIRSKVQAKSVRYIFAVEQPDRDLILAREELLFFGGELIRAKIPPPKVQGDEARAAGAGDKVAHLTDGDGDDEDSSDVYDVVPRDRVPISLAPNSVFSTISEEQPTSIMPMGMALTHWFWL